MSGSPRPVLPITLKLVIVALVLEAAGLVAVGSFAIAAATDGQALVRNAGITEGVVAFALAALLGGFTYALVRRRAWARNPTVFLQLFLLPVGWFMLQAGVWWSGVPLMLVGVLTVLALLSAPVRNVLHVEE